MTLFVVWMRTLPIKMVCNIPRIEIRINDVSAYECALYMHLHQSGRAFFGLLRVEIINALPLLLLYSTLTHTHFTAIIVGSLRKIVSQDGSKLRVIQEIWFKANKIKHDTEIQMHKRRYFATSIKWLSRASVYGFNDKLFGIRSNPSLRPYCIRTGKKGSAKIVIIFSGGWNDATVAIWSLLNHKCIHNPEM